MFTNKHVIVALIVAPILSLIAYFAVDYMVKEKPHSAVEGQSYPLVAKSNCRYTSGECDLVNRDFKIKLSIEDAEGQKSLKLNANHQVQGVQVGIAPSGESLEQVTPATMQIVDGDTTEWRLSLPFETNETTTLAIAITANGSHYFAETNMAFSEYKTLFEEDFRR